MEDACNRCINVQKKKRFTELEQEIPKITPRILTKVLKYLEANGVVKRTIQNTIPVTVENELTESGQLLHQVIDSMVEWGLNHREIVLNKL